MNKFPLYYKTFGDKTDPCILLIMGIGGQLIQWPSALIQGLVKQNFYVVVFDNRDAGLSEDYDHIPTPNIMEVISQLQEGQSFTPPYTLKDMSSDTVSVMDELQIKQAHILGVSMGGMIAQLVALDYPEPVLSLICIATTSGDPSLPPPKPEVLEFFFSPKRQEESLDDYVQNKLQLYKIYNHPSHVDEAALHDLLIKTYHRSNKPNGFKRQLLAIMGTKPRMERLKKLSLPTLVIHGDYDPAFPLEHGKQLAALIPNSRLEIIEKMGHGLPECLCQQLVDYIVTHVK
jgi:pimeloyl-ACP methyl ester carboxylesterase